VTVGIPVVVRQLAAVKAIIVIIIIIIIDLILN
jgi:hypothetical protein